VVHQDRDARTTASSRARDAAPESGDAEFHGGSLSSLRVSCNRTLVGRARVGSDERTRRPMGRFPFSRSLARHATIPHQAPRAPTPFRGCNAT
jgi:hypothetical protein